MTDSKTAKKIECDCCENGADGTLAHIGKIVKVETAGITKTWTAHSCENHLENYLGGSWKLAARAAAPVETPLLSCQGSTTLLCRSMNCEKCIRLRAHQQAERSSPVARPQQPVDLYCAECDHKESAHLNGGKCEAWYAARFQKPCECQKFIQPSEPAARVDPEREAAVDNLLDEIAARVEQPTPELDKAVSRWVAAKHAMALRDDLKGDLQMELRAAERDVDDCLYVRLEAEQLDGTPHYAPAAPVVEQRAKYPVVQHPGGGITNLESAIAAVKRESGNGWRYAEQVLTDWLAASQRTEGEGNNGKS